MRVPPCNLHVMSDEVFCHSSSVVFAAKEIRSECRGVSMSTLLAGSCCCLQSDVLMNVVLDIP